MTAAAHAILVKNEPFQRGIRYNQAFIYQHSYIHMIKGSIVAIVTPMHADGSLDYPGLRKLIEWHIAEGTDGIVIVGTTGESATVSVDEHCELIKFTVETAKGRVPIIAGTGGSSCTTCLAARLPTCRTRPSCACPPFPISSA